jgi:hypothetical protein
MAYARRERTPRRGRRLKKRWRLDKNFLKAAEARRALIALFY